MGPDKRNWNTWSLVRPEKGKGRSGRLGFMWGVICVDKDIHFRVRDSLDNSFSQPTNYTHCKMKLGRTWRDLSLAKSIIPCLLIGQFSQYTSQSNLWLWDSGDGFNNQVTGCGETQGWQRCQVDVSYWLIISSGPLIGQSTLHISIPSGFHKKCPSKDSKLNLDIRPVTNVGLAWLQPRPMAVERQWEKCHPIWHRPYLVRGL